jgi:predicted permease
MADLGDRERLKAETLAASRRAVGSAQRVGRAERMGQDLRLAIRRLKRDAGFSLTVVLILGLGIGMTAAMITVLDTVVLQPLPIFEPDRVVLPQALAPADVRVPFTADQLTDLEEASRTLSDVAGVARHGAISESLNFGDRTLSLRAAWVTGNFFSLLNTRPALGRLLLPDDEVPNASPTSVLVLSHNAWLRHFGGDSTVVGRSLTSPYGFGEGTIVGVAPAGFSYPPGVDYWAPVIYPYLDVMGRLTPGATVEQARSEFLSLARRIRQAQSSTVTPDMQLVRSEVQTLQHAVLGDVRMQAWALAAAAALLLLIACANVGNLTLLRAMTRVSEVAIRRSLGGRRSDILGSVLWEGGVLAAAGGLAGFVSAQTILGALVRGAPAEFPRIEVLRLSPAPVGLAAGATLAVLLLASLPPVLGTMKGRLDASMRGGTRGRRSGQVRTRVRQGLVAVQVALAVVMLAGAALLVRSLDRLTDVPLGYEPEHLSFLLLAKPIDVETEGFSAPMGEMYRRVEREIRGVPGVESLTPVNFFPFVGTQSFNARWMLRGQGDADVSSNPVFPVEVGGFEYFRTFDIPILRGRGFLDTDTENTAPVAVLSRAAAEAFWPGEDPIGKQIRLDGALPWVTVVGEAGDIRYRVLREPAPTVYLPWRQVRFQGYVAIRTTNPLNTILPELREAVRTADPEAQIALAQTMDASLDAQLALPRLSAFLLSTFGVTALLLAALGIFGAMAATVREKSHELGIRAALGASPETLRRMVLLRAAGTAAMGGAAGVAGALLANRLLRSLLFGIPPTDLVSHLGALALLMIAALVAAYVPASWATRADPARALRAE